MIQRRGTYVISATTGLLMLHKGLYDEDGPPTEDADIYGQSLPNPVQFALGVSLTSRIAAAEKENLDGLTKAGFKLDFGVDGSGIYRKYITRLVSKICENIKQSLIVIEVEATISILAAAS